MAQVKGGAGAQIQVASGVVWAASAQRDAAQARLDLLLAGAAEEEITAAKAAVAQAEAALEAARVALVRTEVRASFDGTVTAVNVEPGDVVMPGEVVLVLAMLDCLQARTVDLTELDVARVAEGQAAMVSVDALPDVELKGRVVRIGLQSADYRGDATYPITVELDETVPELRWGMTAVVEIETQ